MLEGEERPSHDSSTGRISLQSINVVNSHIAGVENARLTVTGQMETLVLSGLETLVRIHTITGVQLLIQRLKDRSALASSLQTAHNLRVLPELVQSLVVGLSDSINERIRYAFDTARISREMVGKGTRLMGGPHLVSDVICRTFFSRKFTVQVEGQDRTNHGHSPAVHGINMGKPREPR
jgi:hypothetical protein